MQENEMVEPGAVLAFSEEYSAGAGTYDDGTQLRAAVWGNVHVDTESMTLSVKPAGKTVVGVEKGDIIVGEVTYIKPEAMASVKILGVRGKENRSLLVPVDGTLHIGKIDARYIKQIPDEIRCGDIIRAKVLQLKGGPQLATDRPELGVIQAHSPEGNLLVLQNGKLRDPETGQAFYRKVANDYGQGRI